MPVNAWSRIGKARGQTTHGPSNRLCEVRDTLASSEGALNHDGRNIHGSSSNPNLAGQASAADLDPTIGRVSSWAVDFERLLGDELGLSCFTIFLKKEFSEENIMFWIACERMSKITDHKELQKTAQQIYTKHLAPKALMPVNLDSGARCMVESAIKNPTPEMFKIQQQQIFKLMKFDSYSRFLKSKLYQDCVLAEMGGLPLPVSLEAVSDNLQGSGAAQGGGAGGTERKEEAGPAERNGPVMGGSVKDRMDRKKSDKKGDKKSSSISDKEDSGQEKKKISILPWKNKKKAPKDGDKTVTSSGTEEASLSSRHSSITSSDFRPVRGKFVDMNHCFHMIFPDNEILTITPEPQQTVRHVLLPLLDERGLSLQSVELFLNNTKESIDSIKQKLIDIDQLATSMIGRQIVVERRVVFKIELPNKRVIGVKSKLSKKIIEVLRPVTYKYNLQIDALVVHLSESPVPLDMDITVAFLDGQRILIETLEQYSGSHSISGSRRVSLGPGTGAAQGEMDDGRPRPASVDSFLKDDETVHANPSNSQNENPKAKSSAPALSTVQLGDTRRDQRNLMAAAKPPPQVTNLPPTSASTSALMGPRTGGRGRGNLRVTDTDDLFAMVSKAQSKRLDDQRGLTLRNLQLPDFLKVSDTGAASSILACTESRPKSSLGLSSGRVGPGLQQVQQQGEVKAPAAEALKLRPKSTPPRQNAPLNGDGMFTGGVLPTCAQAEELFGSVRPRTPVVRFNDTVISSTYRDTSWDSRLYVNPSSKTDKLRPSVNGNPLQFGNFGGSSDDKLSPRASRNRLSDGGDSVEYGQNVTVASLELNSSFESADQGQLNTSVTSTATGSPLPLPPTPDLDSTLKVEVANYTPPPTLNHNQVPGGGIFNRTTSQSGLTVRQTPIMHPFSAGTTLPGHVPDPACNAPMDSSSHFSNGHSCSASTTRVSFSNNNSTGLPTSTSVPDIQSETNNCYSNYTSVPTTGNGSYYTSNHILEFLPESKPNRTQVHARERVIKSPPLYHSSMSFRPGKVPYSSTEDPGRSSASDTHLANEPKVLVSGTSDTQFSANSLAPGGPAPSSSYGAHTTSAHTSTHTLQRVLGGGVAHGTGGTHGGTPKGTEVAFKPSGGGGTDHKGTADGVDDFQGKLSVIVSRQKRATFV